MRFRSIILAVEGLAAIAVLGGCGSGGPQSALNPAGPQSRHILGLYHVFLWVCVGVYVLVVLAALLAAMARRGRQEVAADEPIIANSPSGERRTQIVVSSLVGITVIILFVLLISDFVTGQAIHSLADPHPVRITVTGHQWWWEIQYEDPDTPSNIVNTANEIHIPVGRPVRVQLTSNDVIHSFWVPALHGKKDLVPGHPIETWIRADKAGVYPGQCAEFCGYQHARMRLLVVAEAPEQFDAWLAAQREGSKQPASDSGKRGQRVFMSSSCIMCHTIQGTSAGGRVGPNLTHLAGRQTIAAGTLPNTRGNLGGWIADPQQIKPGARMPQNLLAPEDLRALIDYLESLK